MRGRLPALLALFIATTASAAPLALVAPPTRRPAAPLALVLPPDSIAEIIVVEGGVNFLSLYQGLLTIRILLSWFPQAQGVALLRPVFTVSDVYLNLVRAGWLVPRACPCRVRPSPIANVAIELACRGSSAASSRPLAASTSRRLAPFSCSTC